MNFLALAEFDHYCLCHLPPVYCAFFLVYLELLSKNRDKAMVIIIFWGPLANSDGEIFHYHCITYFPTLLVRLDRPHYF